MIMETLIKESMQLCLAYSFRGMFTIIEWEAWWPQVDMVLET